MSDRTGRPVGDRPGRLGEHRSSEAQIRTLLDYQKEQILAECQARIDQHEFQAARAAEEQRLLQGQLLQQKLEFRDAHQRSFTEMEELRKFQSSSFRYDRKTNSSSRIRTLFWNLSGRVQELQNEVNCVNVIQRIFKMLNQFAVEIPRRQGLYQRVSKEWFKPKGCWFNPSPLNHPLNLPFKQTKVNPNKFGFHVPPPPLLTTGGLV